MVCTISLIWCMVFLIGNNFLWTNWSVNSFTAQSVCFFIVCLCWCYCCYRHRHLCSIRSNIHICIELVILKSYWFAYHANNAFNVHDGANATTNWIGLPCETRNNERCLTFFQLDLNGMAKINRDNGSDRWRYHQKYNYKTNTRTNERIHFTCARICNIYFCYTFYLNADIFVNVPRFSNVIVQICGGRWSRDICSSRVVTKQNTQIVMCCVH